jgi:hypothetical protein
MAAAVLLLVAAVVWFGVERMESPVRVHDDVAVANSGEGEDLLRAAEEARYVFALANRALKRSGQAAVRGVLTEQVAPAFQRIIIEWPEGAEPDERRQGV